MDTSIGSDTIRTSELKETERKKINEIFDYDLKNFELEDESLLAITALASKICKTSMSFVTLVGNSYTDFVSRDGCPLTDPRRESSFCDLVNKQENFFEICDLTKDIRFDESGFVKWQSEPLKYYGAFPLKSPNGFNLGSLCVCDRNPKKLNDDQILALKTLSEQLVVHFELRKQNKQIQILVEKAKKLARAKDDFISNMSHELRTPLNAINGFADVLSKTDLDFKQKEAVEIVKSSCEMLITLINDILDFSKIESGKFAIDKAPFNLRKAMKHIKDLLNKKALDSNNILNLKIDREIPTVLLGDKMRINQIIVNLVGNSLKFTENGHVEIEIKISDETLDNVSIDFSVKDTGIGIPQDKLGLIFERFKQARAETTRKYGGTGLGLNISKNLVNMQGGSLKVRSELRKGSEFYFTITYDKVNEEEQLKKELESKRLSALELRKNMRILICEDNLVNIKLFKHLFRNRLSLIEIAENGKIAIEILEKNKNFDLILMDIHMPEMDGMETTKYIRTQMGLKDIPIIGFTASFSKSEKELSLMNGMNDYITKTFVYKEFYESISNAFQEKKKYSENKPKIKALKRRKYYSFKTIRNVKEEIDNEELHLLKSAFNNRKKRSSTLISGNAKFLSKFSFGSNFNSLNGSNITCVLVNEEISDDVFLNNTIVLNKSMKKKENILQKRYVESDYDSEVASFDSLYLKEISCDDLAFEKEFIELFLDEFPIQIKDLEKAIDEKDLIKVKFSIHKMKSSLKMLGLSPLLDEIIKIEKVCKGGFEDYASIKHIFDKVKIQIEDDSQKLRIYIKTFKK